MKKFKVILLILTISVMSSILYGCSNSKPIHSVKYYYNHQSQMRKVVDECNYPTTKVEFKIFESTNYGKNCINAFSAAQKMF